MLFPGISTPRMADIQIMVRPALWLRGSLNAVTPFEMHSTPVNAVVPLENALRMRNNVTGWATSNHLQGWRVYNCA